jgi:MYXO-CTERM domain-containing protein
LSGAANACRSDGAGRSGRMEIVYFIGAFVLLAALIFGVLQYRYRDRAAAQAGGEIVKERYKRNET